MENLCYSVDTYTSDGNRVTKCVLLHIGKTILEFDSSGELETFADEIKAMIPEIRQSELERQ